MSSAKMYEVPADLFAEAGLRVGGAPTRSYRSDDAIAVLVPIAEIRGPVIAPGRRGLDEQRLRSIISAIAANKPLPPVPVYSELDQPRVMLLDGAHRFAVSLVYGYRDMPCRVVSRQEAEETYCYPGGQR